LSAIFQVSATTKEKRKRPANKKPETKTDEETEGIVRKEVKGFF
jgi:hypothetical protein